MLGRTALETMGFAALGQNVVISDRASVYNSGRISIGSDVRVDDFCVLSAGKAGISGGDHVHIAAFCSLVGLRPRVTLEEGMPVTAFSLINRDCAAFGIHVGSPVKWGRERTHDLYDTECRLRKASGNGPSGCP